MRSTAIVGESLRLAYGCYSWAVLLLVSLPLAVVLAVTPGVRRRRTLARLGAKLFFWAIGSPVRIEGQVPRDEACIVVANHSSYLDGIILTAALPPNFTFLIKHEMTLVPLAGFVLKRLGSKFVNREDPRHRKQTARQLVAAARNGDALAFFPEGMFDEAIGLKPFLPGAFSAAWRAELPVVPVVVLGARSKLPSGAVLPAPGAISVRICPPLAAEAHDSARKLMLATRSVILEHLGEPDLTDPELADPELTEGTIHADGADHEDAGAPPPPPDEPDRAERDVT